MRWRLLPVLFLVWATACERALHQPAVHVVPAGVREGPVAVGRVSRMGFEARLGQEQRVTFESPAMPARLRLACTWVVRAGERGRSKVVFQAVLRDGDRIPTTVLDETAPAGSWIERTVPLPATSRRELELVLTADSVDSSVTGTAYWATPVVTTSESERPNIVLISIDCLRADHLGCYGYRRPTSPTIDSLAANGCVFKRAVA
jgi:hypothetical protein